MTATRTLVSGMAADLDDIPTPVRRMLLASTRSLAALVKRSPNDLTIAYGFDCHQQLLRSPWVPAIITLLVSSDESMKTAYRAYLRSGRYRDAEPPEGFRRLGTGLILLVEGLASLFDGDLLEEEDHFVFAYSDVLRSLDYKSSADQMSFLDVVPLSLPLYRQFIGADLSLEVYEHWAFGCVEAIRRATNDWLDVSRTDN